MAYGPRSRAVACCLGAALLAPVHAEAATLILRCSYTQYHDTYKGGEKSRTQPFPASWRIYRISDSRWESVGPGDDDWNSIDCASRCTLTENTLTDAWDFRDQSELGGATILLRKRGLVSINRADGKYAYQNTVDTYRIKFPDGSQMVKLPNGTVRKWNGRDNDEYFGVDYRVEMRSGTCAPTTDPFAARKKAF